MIAALLGAGEPDVLAQRIEQRGAHVECKLAALAVDAHRRIERAARVGGRRLRRSLRRGPVEETN
jgi:hypothetical protein